VANQIPTYLISMDDEESGVFAVSFVKSPATEKSFVALSEQKKVVKLAKDNYKQILTGVVLVPDQKIIREDENGELYYIQFTAEVIEKIRDRMFERNYTHTTTSEHEIKLDKNFIVEAWTIIDPQKDKIAALGFPDELVGSLCLSYSVPDKKYWEEEILTGNKTGFSIEGFLIWSCLNSQQLK
jgi:hypothetical protein